MKVHITQDNFNRYAEMHYDCIFFERQEFVEDLKRIVYVKRLLNLYIDKDDLRERLILNHLVILSNVFGTHSIAMLFLKLSEYKIQLKTLLTFLNLMPNQVEYVNCPAFNVIDSEISIDPEMWKKLQML